MLFHNLNVTLRYAFDFELDDSRAFRQYLGVRKTAAHAQKVQTKILQIGIHFSFSGKVSGNRRRKENRFK
nr:unnamed protein product [Callosobruchus chinensis]